VPDLVAVRPGLGLDREHMRTAQRLPRPKRALSASSSTATRSGSSASMASQASTACCCWSGRRRVSGPLIVHGRPGRVVLHALLHSGDVDVAVIVSADAHGESVAGEVVDDAGNPQRTLVPRREAVGGLARPSLESCPWGGQLRSAGLRSCPWGADPCPLHRLAPGRGTAEGLAQQRGVDRAPPVVLARARPDSCPYAAALLPAGGAPQKGHDRLPHHPSTAPT
jgi:hypothetical protein